MGNIWEAIKTHKWWAIGIGGAVVVGIVIYKITHQSSSSNNTTSDLLATSGSGPTGTVGNSGGDGTAGGGGNGVSPASPVSPVSPNIVWPNQDTTPGVSPSPVSFTPPPTSPGPVSGVAPYTSPSTVIALSSLPNQPTSSSISPNAATVNVQTQLGQTVAVPYNGAMPTSAEQVAIGNTITANEVTAGLTVNQASGAVAINNPYYSMLPATAPQGTISQQDVNEAIASSYTKTATGTVVPVQAAPSGNSKVIPVSTKTTTPTTKPTVTKTPAPAISGSAGKLVR